MGQGVWVLEQQVLAQPRFSMLPPPPKDSLHQGLPQLNATLLLLLPQAFCCITPVRISTTYSTAPLGNQWAAQRLGEMWRMAQWDQCFSWAQAAFFPKTTQTFSGMTPTTVWALALWLPLFPCMWWGSVWQKAPEFAAGVKAQKENMKKTRFL